MEKSMASIAVKNPTRQVMPTVMMISVRKDLRKLVRNEFNASFIFSK